MTTSTGSLAADFASVTRNRSAVRDLLGSAANVGVGAVHASAGCPRCGSITPARSPGRCPDVRSGVERGGVSGLVEPDLGPAGEKE